MEPEELTEAQPVRGRNPSREMNKATVRSPSPKRMRHDMDPYHVKEKKVDRDSGKVSQSTDLTGYQNAFDSYGEGHGDTSGSENEPHQGSKTGEESRGLCQERSSVPHLEGHQKQLEINQDLDHRTGETSKPVLDDKSSDVMRERVKTDSTTQEPTPQHSCSGEKPCMKCRVRDVDREIMQMKRQSQTMQKTPETEGRSSMEEMNPPNMMDTIAPNVMGPSHGETAEETPLSEWDRYFPQHMEFPKLKDRARQDPKHSYCTNERCAKCRLKDMDRELLQMIKHSQSRRKTPATEKVQHSQEQTYPPNMMDTVASNVMGPSRRQSVQETPLSEGDQYFPQPMESPKTKDRTRQDPGPEHSYCTDERCVTCRLKDMDRELLQMIKHSQSSWETPSTEGGQHSQEQTYPPNMMDWIASNIMGPSHGQTMQETPWPECGGYSSQQVNIPSMMDGITVKEMGLPHGQVVQETPVTEEGQYSQEQTNPPKLKDSTRQDPGPEHSYCTEKRCVKCRLKDMDRELLQMMKHSQSRRETPSTEEGQYSQEQTNPPKMDGTTQDPITRNCSCGEDSCAYCQINNLQMIIALMSVDTQTVETTPEAKSGCSVREQTNPPNMMDRTTQEPFTRYCFCGEDSCVYCQLNSLQMMMAQKVEDTQTAKTSPEAKTGCSSVEHTNTPNMMDRTSQEPFTRYCHCGEDSCAYCQLNSLQMIIARKLEDTETVKTTPEEKSGSSVEQTNSPDKMDRTTPKVSGPSDRQTAQEDPESGHGGHEPSEQDGQDQMTAEQL